MSLPSKIGTKVNFTTPKSVRDTASPVQGTVKDEVWHDEALLKSPPRPASSAGDWGDYAYFSQLIEWDNGEKSIRLGYYYRAPEKTQWRFGSQWTIEDSPATIGALIEKTLQRKEWFL